MELKHRCNQILELGFPLGKLFAQDWEGDVTIVMSATLNQVQWKKIIIIKFLFGFITCC